MLSIDWEFNMRDNGVEDQWKCLSSKVKEAIEVSVPVMKVLYKSETKGAVRVTLN